MEILKTSQLSKCYGTTVAVDALNLVVNRGEIFGLLGPNGAGKTTTISLICGITQPTQGTIHINGHNLGTADLAARQQIGLVPQEIALYDNLSATENLRFFGAPYGLGGAELRKCVADALKIAGLSARAHEPVKNFSGGMKRRLNLVAGILHCPALLVLDEPTVGVDPQSRNFLFETIRKLNRDHGVTVIYTSHYMEEVQALCTRVGVMDHGKIIALDTVEGLIRSHAPTALLVRFDGDPKRVAESVCDFGEFVIDGDTLRVPIPDSHADVVSAIEHAGAKVRSLHSLEPGLETVYLSLTGHTPRDNSL